MPIYEYRCESCGHELEKMQKLAEAPLTDCPSCGQPALKKLISAAGFRLKGGGWYETDFKQGDRKKNLHDSGEKKGGDAASAGDSKKTASDGGSGTKAKSETKSTTTAGA